MLHLAIEGVRRNTGRYIATLVAIITGVAFFTAAGFVSDGIIKALEGDVDEQYGTVDVAVVLDEDAGTEFAEQLVIPGDVYDEIAAVDGVDAVGGELTGPVAFGDEDGSTFGDGATGRLWVEDDELNPVDVVEGDAPTEVSEIAVDQGLADEESLAVGDEVTLLTVGGEFDVTVVGLTAFGGADSLDSGGTVSLPAAATFDRLNSGLVEYRSVYVRGSEDPVALTDEISGLVPDGFIAQSGDDFRDDKRAEVGQVGQFLKQGLQFFALIALFVGGFVIYNTFTVIVAQRQRELAVLSAIGATPKQLKRSLRLEGLVIGVLGAILGVVTGFLLALLLGVILEALGLSLGHGGVEVGPSNVISGIVLGTVITFLSVTIPARRAARTEPIEAMRDAAVESGAVTRDRMITSGVLVGLGLLGLFVAGSPVLIGLGVLLLVVGIIVSGPIIAVVGAKLLRPVGGALGLEGRLAVDNAARNPKRTATTANALLIGVFLVTFVSVAGTSLKDYVVAEIQQLEGADFGISSDGGSIDPELVEALEGVDGVVAVTPYRRESVTLDGQASQLSTADTGALVETAGISAAEGSLDDLVPGTIAVTDPSQADPGQEPIELGSTVTVADSTGQTLDVEVVAVLDVTLDTAEVGNLVVPETFDELVGDTAPTAAFLDVEDGEQTDTEDAIDELLARRPDITLTEGNTLAKLLSGVFDFMINAVNGLLVMSVIVALIGIVNTLSLSIIERRRELGLLRIVGMTDRRVQRMVRLESALIAALGTVTGLVLGLVIGWGLVLSITRLSDTDIGFGFPAILLGIVLVLGILLGFLASLIPARRSTRLEVLDAIAAT